MKKKDDEAPPSGIKTAIGFVAAVGAIFTLGALALFPPKTGLSVLAGALIATSNLWVLTKIVEALLTPDPDVEETADDDAPKDPEPPKKGFSTPWAALAAVKMLVLFGGTWILMTKGLVDPLGLMVGYGSLPVGVGISGVAAGLRPKKRR